MRFNNRFVIQWIKGSWEKTISAGSDVQTHNFSFPLTYTNLRSVIAIDNSQGSKCLVYSADSSGVKLGFKNLFNSSTSTTTNQRILSVGRI